MVETKQLFKTFRAEHLGPKIGKGKKWVDNGRFDKHSITNRRTAAAVGLVKPTELKPAFTKEAKARAASNRKASLAQLQLQMDTRVQFQKTEFIHNKGRLAPSHEKQVAAHTRKNEAAASKAAQYEAAERVRIDEVYAGQCIQFASELAQNFKQANEGAERATRRMENQELTQLLAGKTDREVINAIALHVGITEQDF